MTCKINFWGVHINQLFNRAQLTGFATASRAGRRTEPARISLINAQVHLSQKNDMSNSVYSNKTILLSASLD